MTTFRSAIFILVSLLPFRADAWYGEKVSSGAAKQKEEIKELLADMQENMYRDLPQVLSTAEKAVAMAESIYSAEDLYTIYAQVGMSYEHHNRQDSALIYFSHALEYAKQLQDTEKILGAYNDLATIYRRKAEYKKSEEYYLSAMAVAEEEDIVKAQENLHHGLGSLYKDIGAYQKAVEHYIASVKLAEKRGHLEYVIHSQQYLALTYAEAGNYESALETIKEASEKAATVQDTILKGIVVFDYGKILGGAEKYTESLQKFEKSLEYFRMLGHKPLITRSYFYIADTYTQLEQPEKAREFFQKCEENEQFISARGQADLNFKLGEMYLSEGDIEYAKSYFKKSLLLAEDRGFKDFCHKNHYELFKLYDAENRPAEALVHLKSYTNVHDSLFSEEYSKAITEMEIKYETDKKESDIKDLKNQKAKTMLFSILALLGLFTAALMVLTFMARRNNKSLRAKNLEIEEKNTKLKESNEVLQQFAYVAAHDLKEPMRSIGSFTNLLQRRYRDVFDEQGKEYMDFIRVAVTRMDRLLASLLEYSGVTMQNTGTTVLEPRSVLSDVMGMMEQDLSQKQVQIESELIPAVKMNEIHLQQIFQNMIRNAVDFCENRPYIKVKGKQVGDRVFFEIEDNGIGIDEATGNKVFKLFYREDRSEASGAGVGLTICKNIVDKYNGYISFSSVQGQGTTFSFDLPAAEAA